jgi:hypothetical protein
VGRRRGAGVCWGPGGIARLSWLGKPSNELPEKQEEMWHGKWFREKSAFFDPDDAYFLPVACESCCAERKVYCGAHLVAPFVVEATKDLWDEERKVFATECGHCGDAIAASKEELWRRGDPQNVPLQFHCDGFQPLKTSPKGAFVVDFLPTSVPKVVKNALNNGYLGVLSLPPKKNPQTSGQASTGSARPCPSHPRP